MPQAAELNFTLLRFLKKQERPVLPSEIEDELGLDHADLITELERLADTGYEIELHPYLGVRLLDIPDRLLAHEITESLNTKVVGKRIHVLESCGSTSDELWTMFENKKANDGELVIAEQQTAGRGRMGRTWESPRARGLYLSFLYKGKIEPDRAIMLTCAASLALANTIEQFVHLPATIKWPNDIYIGNRKVAGVLVETRSNPPLSFVVGIGLNVNQTASDFPEALREAATSLRIERKSGPLNRVRLLRPLLFYLDTVFAQVRKKKFDRIARAWKAYLPLIGHRVAVTTSGKEYSGELLDFDPLEGIKLREASGNEKTLRVEHTTAVSEVR